MSTAINMYVIKILQYRRKKYSHSNIQPSVLELMNAAHKIAEISDQNSS